MLTISGGNLNQALTGVQRYEKEIIDNIIDLCRAQYTANCGIKIVGHVSRPNQSTDIMNKIGSLTPRPLWNQTLLPLISSGMLLSLGNIGPIIKKKQILCIHDVNIYLVPESYKQSFVLYYKFLLPILTRRVRHLTTVSQFSKNMLLKHICPSRDEIHVIPNGREHVLRWRPENSTLRPYSEESGAYVLMIGSQAKHKNMRVVACLAEELMAQGIKLVITGRSGSKFSELGADDLKGAEIVDASNDDDLAALYSGALCLAFPSRTEGFGLPPLEAMTLGCPVVTSTAASMPEVCGSAALYANPDNPRDWMEAIMTLRHSVSMRRHLIAEGHLQSKKFSWRESAKMYLKLAGML